MPSVALVDPQFPLNVGYVGRAMANFGVKRLFIVGNNESQIDWDEATKFASHGQDVVKKIQIVKSIDSLRRKHLAIVGTTAIRAKRKSNISRTTMDFDSFLPMLAKTLAQRSKSYSLAKVCFVFGRDTTGLTNEELRACDYAVTIETGTAYRTLNISHAVSIVLYEASKFLRTKVKNQTENSEIGSSYVKERELLVKLYLELAEVSDFQEYKKQKLAQSLSRLVNRSNPSLRETYLLLGLASKAKSKIVQLQKNSG